MGIVQAQFLEVLREMCHDTYIFPRKNQGSTETRLQLPRLVGTAFDEVSLCLARGLTFDHPHICLRLTDL